ncbi:MAG: cupin [Rhizobiales bacterium]|nr:cupin [Hyphomicrobiales bacterium]
MTVQHFTEKDAKFYKRKDRQIFLGDVVDPSNGATMSVGFGRYMKKGETNEFIITYDEALIITKGVFTVHSDGGAITAKAGEVIWLTKGTKVVYEAAADNTELVYVTYPHWMAAQAKSEHASLLDAFQPVG